MRAARAVVLLLVPILSSACNTVADPVSARPLHPGSADLSLVGGGQRVTGSATIILPNHGNALEHYSVSAVHQPDGPTTGEFEEYSEQDGGQRIHASVVCFTVTGNSARLAARIDQTNVSFGPVGSYVVWSVIDNGEGARSAPDQTTDIFFGGTAAQADFQCRTGFNLAPYFSSLRGNLQVQ